MTATRTEARPARRCGPASSASWPATSPPSASRYGVPAWSEEDRERLEATLWRFIHPDLAHSPADPYHDPDED